MHSIKLKKIVLIVLAILISGCSAIPLDLSFLTPATAGPTNTPPSSATSFPTSTATRDPFATNTEGPTATLEPGVTPLPASNTPPFTATLRPTITLMPVDPSLFTPSANIFNFVQRSTNQLIWGYNCDGARSIQFIVTVTPVRRMRYVLLFIRLQDKYSARRTEWGAGAIMSDNDQGKYFYTIHLDQIEDYEEYTDAWLQYQFVASTVGLTRLGSSVVDRTSVSLTHCSIINRR
jgi:hypothetical protein